MKLLNILILLLCLCSVMPTICFINYKHIQNENKSTKIKPSFYTEEFRITAYCPCEYCCGKYADGITANGHVIKRGDKFVAAPSAIPFNTKMDIPVYGKQIKVLDRGGVIEERKHNHRRLDIYFHSHREAKQWGIRYYRVKVYNAK